MGCSRRILHPVASGRTALPPGVSQQPFRPLPCLAEHIVVGSVFPGHGNMDTPLQYCGGSFVVTAGNRGFAGNVFPVDCSVTQSVAGRTLPTAIVRFIG